MAERREGCTYRLVCVECAVRSDDVAGNWRAYLNSDDEVVIFCPSCAVREFGDATGATEHGGER